MNPAAIILPPTYDAHPAALKTTVDLRRSTIVESIVDASGLSAAAASGFKEKPQNFFRLQTGPLGKAVAEVSGDPRYRKVALCRLECRAELAADRAVVCPTPIDWSITIAEPDELPQRVVDEDALIAFLEAMVENPLFAPHDGLHPMIAITVDKPNNGFRIPPINEAYLNQIGDDVHKLAVDASVEASRKAVTSFVNAVLEELPDITDTELPAEEVEAERRRVGQVLASAASMFVVIHLTLPKALQFLKTIDMTGVENVRTLGPDIPTGHRLTKGIRLAEGPLGFGKATLQRLIPELDVDHVLVKGLETPKASKAPNLEDVVTNGPIPSEEKAAEIEATRKSMEGFKINRGGEKQKGTPDVP